MHPEAEFTLKAISYSRHREGQLKLAVLEDIPFDINGVQGGIYVVENPNKTRSIYCNFIGTNEASDLSIDANIFHNELELPYPEVMKPDSPVRVHRGFMASYRGVREQVLGVIGILLQNNSSITQVTFAGHSKGGAEATLAALDCQFHLSTPEISESLGRQLQVNCVTVGSPRVGNRAFRDSFDRRVPGTIRVAHKLDPVTAEPAWWLGYAHVGKELTVGEPWRFMLMMKRLPYHFLENYIKGLSKLIAESE